MPEDRTLTIVELDINRQPEVIEHPDIFHNDVVLIDWSHLSHLITIGEWPTLLDECEEHLGILEPWNGEMLGTAQKSYDLLKILHAYATAIHDANDILERLREHPAYPNRLANIELPF